ncbi:GspE/PulE family protein [Natroniella sulfidigena]|uniref:GspE/PulE family protein n=1 Tax=Natroniella sulfidigena TaxID=723921 RepID=UPI002009FF70|nr:GspE/PulE family protein [Natroniella sulfidigena]MCK8817481.1 GspE/PulE family protein [Natroniella sulfidigena]
MEQSELGRHYEVENEIIEDLDKLELKEEYFNINKDELALASMIEIVDLIINQAVKAKVSDIHFEVVGEKLRVRYRIDGLLQEVLTLPQKLQPALVSRIKIMADLDIAIKRVPQDGRKKWSYKERQIDLRIAILPTVAGEKVVIRILDKQNLLFDLEELGFSCQIIPKLKRMINQSHGMILVSGPTGSGKTTTLYSIINQLNSTTSNIITIEDPVEYRLLGINQVQINSKVNLGFATGLRAILRQDPDIIMVGEIRDYETAKIAIQSSLTGHLVLSTIHTNDAVSSVIRLIEMGVEDFLVASSVVGIIAQRLVRKICDNCKEEYRLQGAESEQFYFKEQLAVGETFYRGAGCLECNYLGYQGRTVIYEVLNLDHSLRELITEGASSTQLKRFVLEQGMESLVESGIKKAKAGITTLAEVKRVTSRVKTEIKVSS